MWALLQKEISGFFSSLTGYIVIIVFLLLSGLFLWVFPGGTNIPDSGYADLRPLFDIAPWIFLFLIPAITMRAFAEEKKSGTIDLLNIRPLTSMQIIIGKYLSALILAILAILPTLVYYVSIILLGDTAGNIDHGAVWGSYIGLILLAASYTAIGIFSSTITDNIIVAFILGIFLCFLTYYGFESMANAFPSAEIGVTLQNLGIDVHYQSMSRGVIDSRDVFYFLTVVLFFLIITNLTLNGRRYNFSLLIIESETQLKKEQKIALIYGIVLILYTVFNAFFFIQENSKILPIIKIIYLATVLPIKIAASVLCTRITNNLNRNSSLWGLLGFLISPFSLIICALLKKQ